MKRFFFLLSIFFIILLAVPVGANSSISANLGISFYCSTDANCTDFGIFNADGSSQFTFNDEYYQVEKFLVAPDGVLIALYEGSVTNKYSPRLRVISSLDGSEVFNQESVQPWRWSRSDSATLWVRGYDYTL